MPQANLSLSTLRFLQERLDVLTEHFWTGTHAQGTDVSPELRQAVNDLRVYLTQLEAGDSGVSRQEISRQEVPGQVSKQTERLEVLAALSLSDKDLTSLLEQITQVTTALLPASGGSSVALWNEVTNRFELTTTTVLGQTPELATSSIRTQGGATRWIMDHKHARIMPDVTKDELGNTPMLAKFGLKALIGVPLLVANEVLGVLYAFDKTTRDYSQEDLHFMTILASRAASAVYQTRLLAKTQSALSSSLALQRVSSSLIAPADSVMSLQTVVDSIALALTANRVLLLTLNSAERQVTRFVVGGEDRTRLAPDPFEQYWQGLTGWVMRERKTAFSPKGVTDERESQLNQERRQKRKGGSLIVVPLVFKEHVYGTITVVRDMSEDDFVDTDITLMEEFAAQAAITIRNSELYQETKYLATIDDLTGSFNRRQLFELGERELKRHTRLRHPLAALMFDIDYFKRVNDAHGHAVGDEVLRLLAQRATLQIREIDILGRYGGEEFAVLLPETQLAEALEIAERLRHAATEPVIVNGSQLSITISVGVTEADGDPTLSHLLQRADAALYQAKHEGRNRVVVKQGGSRE
jgi:diguanylate cyclase (GGDEF)-like protein